MSDREQPHLCPSWAGHQYQHVQVNEGARAHLRDTYYISRDDPLSLLQFATNTPFNSYDRQHESTCLPNTRVDVLQKISRWGDGGDQQCLFWLSGMAGTGKTTIAHTVARGYFKQAGLAASFFFSRGGGDVGTARKFVTTIAVQLAMHILPVQRYIRDAVTERSNIASQSLTDQWR